jgi:hypothetical protein
LHKHNAYLLLLAVVYRGHVNGGGFIDNRLKMERLYAPNQEGATRTSRSTSFMPRLSKRPSSLGVVVATPRPGGDEDASASNAILMPPNLRDCVFVVVPKFQYNYSNQHETAQERSQLKLDKKGLSESVSLLDLMADISVLNGSEDALGLDVEHLRVSALQVVNERKNNDTEEIRMQGEAVHYGTDIMLRHESSGKYLTTQKKRAEVDDMAMRCCLLEHGTEGSWLKFSPAYKSKRDGERVLFRDVAHLATNGAQYLHITSELEMSIPPLHMYVQKTLEANMSQEPTRFTLVPVRQSNEAEPEVVSSGPQAAIRGGECLTFFHREDNSNFVYDPVISDNPVFLELNSRALRSDTFNSNAVWKVEGVDVEWSSDAMAWKTTGSK